MPIDVNFNGDLKNAKGEVYTKFTCGLALFYLPFFLAAHLYTYIAHVDSSGYSAPYCYALIVCGVFWAFVGLFVLKRLLGQYFDPVTVWLTLLCIMFGTNFYCYATFQIGMPHVYNFMLIASALLAMDNFYKMPAKGMAITAGLLLGLIVLIRPTNILIVIFLVLYRVVTVKDIIERIRFLKQNANSLLTAVPFFIVPFIPQILYWKSISGNWIMYSYNTENFRYWASPKIAAVLFDTQNGLFLYSPALLIMFWGLFIKRKDPRTSFIGVGVIFVVITYVFASWWAWWFGGAFGHRCYIDYFPVFAFPLAITFELLVRNARPVVKTAIFSGLILCCYYNIALTNVFVTKQIWDGPEWRWNWRGWAHVVHHTLIPEKEK